MRLIILLLFLTVIAKAQPIQNLDNGRAVKGYDVVAYFENKALIGNPKFSTSYNKATYLFANEKHLNEFVKNPNKYLPSYGGWCAYALGQSAEKVDINPETYKILNGKLYLFYNKFFNNTLEKWNKNETLLKKQADTNWLKYSKL